MLLQIGIVLRLQPYLCCINSLEDHLQKEKLIRILVVLVQGLGGVSIFAIQIAKLFNAKVIATTSNEERMLKAKEIGADFVINYNQETNGGKKYKRLPIKKVLIL